MKSLILLIFWLFTPTLWAGRHYDVLPAAKAKEMLSKPCSVVHVWASWCGPCVKELPGVIRSLAKLKNVQPVVIDLSSPFVQESFSKRFLISIGTSLKTYLKNEDADKKYMREIDPHWDGSLPYTAFFGKGQKRRVWKGTLDLTNFGQEVSQLCEGDAKFHSTHLSRR